MDATDKFREAYVRPAGMFGHYGSATRAAEWDDMIAQVRTDAAREALGGLQAFARECMDGEHGDLDKETQDGWHHTWAAVLQHRATHYPMAADEVEQQT